MGTAAALDTVRAIETKRLPTNNGRSLAQVSRLSLSDERLIGTVLGAWTTSYEVSHECGRRSTRIHGYPTRPV